MAELPCSLPKQLTLHSFATAAAQQLLNMLHVCGLAALAMSYNFCQLLWQSGWQLSHHSLRSLTKLVSHTEIKIAAQDCQIKAVCIAMIDALPDAHFFEMYTSTFRHHQHLLAQLHAMLARCAAGEAWPCPCPCPWQEWMDLHYTPDMTFAIATMPTCLLLRTLITHKGRSQ